MNYVHELLYAIMDEAWYPNSGGGASIHYLLSFSASFLEVELSSTIFCDLVHRSLESVFAFAQVIFPVVVSINHLITLN